MKKLYILVAAAILAIGVVSCSKDDDKTTTTPTPTPTPTKIDVWAKSIGTYTGTVLPKNGDPSVENQTLTITQVNNNKLQVTNGAGNTYVMPSQSIDVNVGDSTILNQQGAFVGTIAIYVSSNANNKSQIIYTDDTKGFSFSGIKQ